MDASMFSFYLTEFKHKRGSFRHLHHSLHQSIISTNTHELSQSQTESDTLNHFHTHSTQLFTTNKRSIIEIVLCGAIKRWKTP